MNDEEITLRYDFDENLMRQAVVAWRTPNTGRKHPFLSFVRGGVIGLVLLAIMFVVLEEFPQSGLLLAHFQGALIGAVFIVLYWQWKHGREMKAVIARIRDSENCRGETVCVLGPSGLRYSSTFGETHLKWVGVDRIVPLKGGLAFVVGAQTITLPESVFPADITPPQFLSQLETWRAAR